jgi:hypothetical protein
MHPGRLPARIGCDGARYSPRSPLPSPVRQDSTPLCEVRAASHSRGMRCRTTKTSTDIYHVRYQRTGDGWKLTGRVYEIRYLDHSPLAGSVPCPAGAPADPPAGNTPAAEGRR